MSDFDKFKEFEVWKEGLSIEGKVMYSLMESFTEDFSPEGDPADVELLTTNDIIDRLFDMGVVEMQFVNVYLRFGGYKTTKVNGRVVWRLYRNEE